MVVKSMISRVFLPLPCRSGTKIIGEAGAVSEDEDHWIMGAALSLVLASLVINPVSHMLTQLNRLLHGFTRFLLGNWQVFHRIKGYTEFTIFLGLWFFF